MSSERPVPWAQAPVATARPRMTANTLIAKRMEHPPDIKTRALPVVGHRDLHITPAPVTGLQAFCSCLASPWDAESAGWGRRIPALPAHHHQLPLGLRPPLAGALAGRVAWIDLSLEQ